jgi:hypothetical protein
MAHWLKNLGSGTGRMDESLIPRVLRELRFPRRPRVAVGDKMALYALGHDRVFAIVEIFARPYEIEGPNNWDRWEVETRPVLSMGYHGAPRLADLTVDRDLELSVRQQSHIGLTGDEYRRAVELLRAAGATEDGLYRP